MSRSYYILVTLVFLTVLGGLLYGFYYFTAEENPATGERAGFFEIIFPFGDTGQRHSQERISTTTENGAERKVPQLRQVTNLPVAGAVVFEREGKEYIRYIEKETAHIFETTAGELSLTQISNVTIPRIIEAVWSNDGSHVVFRYRDGDIIESFSAKIVEEEGRVSFDGDFLDQNITQLAILDSGEIGYHLLTEGGSSVIRANIDGTGKQTIYESSLSGWLISWVDRSLAFMVPKPSATADGYVMRLSSSGTLQTLVGPFKGLAALPDPEGDELLLSANLDTPIHILIHSLGKETSGSALVQTLPEKCVWSREGERVVFCAVPREIQNALYPDDWYKGVVSFSDNIWRIDLGEGIIERIMTLSEEAGQDIDATHLMLSPSELYLLFINKKDSSLWSLRLKEEEVLPQNSSGGEGE